MGGDFIEISRYQIILKYPSVGDGPAPVGHHGETVGEG